MPGPIELGKSSSAAAQVIEAVSKGPVPVLAATTVATNTFAGFEVVGLAGLLNVVAQPIKMQPWFRQNTWLLPLLLVLGIGVAFLVLWLITDDLRQSAGQAILKGGSATWQSAINYGALGPEGLKVLPAGTDGGKQGG